MSNIVNFDFWEKFNNQKMANKGTVNFLNIRTPKKYVLITLKFELCGSTIE